MNLILSTLTMIILALASWRVAAMITTETGPGHIFEKLRIKSGIIHDIDGNVEVIPVRFFAELLSCVWCFSFWSALFWTGFYFLLPHAAVWCALPFALSAGAILIDRLAH